MVRRTDPFDNPWGAILLLLLSPFLLVGFMISMWFLRRQTNRQLDQIRAERDAHLRLIKGGRSNAADQQG